MIKWGSKPVRAKNRLVLAASIPGRLVDGRPSLFLQKGREGGALFSWTIHVGGH